MSKKEVCRAARLFCVFVMHGDILFWGRAVNNEIYYRGRGKQ